MNRRLRRKNRKRNDLVQHLSGSATPCFELLNAKDAKEDHAESRQVGVVSSQLAKPLHCFARTFASFALKVLSTLHLTEVAAAKQRERLVFEQGSKPKQEGPYL